MANKNVVKVDFTKREVTGKSFCRKIRGKNQIPVVLYGPDYKKGLPGIVPAKTITPVVLGAHTETTLIELTMDDGTQAAALIRAVQRHPLTKVIRHIDLYQVRKGHQVKVAIPVYVTNVAEARGVKDGGVLTQALRLLEISVQPSDIPESITVDATNLAIGDEILVKDLKIPEGAKLISDPEALVTHITETRAEEETPAAAEEENKEVEVVAKGKAAKEAEEEPEEDKKK